MVRVALVEERLKSFGLVRTKLDKKLANGAPNAPAPYVRIGRRPWQGDHGERPEATRTSRRGSRSARSCADRSGPS